MIKKISALFLILVIFSLEFSLSPKSFAASKVIPNGRGIWVWHVEQENFYNDTNILISRLNNAGITWVAIKAGDGDSLWTTYALPWLVNNISRLHNAGIKVYGWQYVYGNDDKYGIPNVSEADVAKQILNISGIDGLIIDAETEYEYAADNRTKAENYMQSIRQEYPDSFIAHSPYARPNSHTNFPYLEFNKYCDAVLPQAYWVDRPTSPTYELTVMEQQWNSLYASWYNNPSYSQWVNEGKNPIKPIYPAVSFTNVPLDQVGEFFTILPRFGYQNPNFWRYGVISYAVWNCLFGGSCTTPPPPPPPPPPTPPPTASAPKPAVQGAYTYTTKWVTRCTKVRGKKVCKRYKTVVKTAKKVTKKVTKKVVKRTIKKVTKKTSIRYLRR